MNKITELINASANIPVTVNQFGTYAGKQEVHLIGNSEHGHLIEFNVNLQIRENESFKFCDIDIENFIYNGDVFPIKDLTIEQYEEWCDAIRGLIEIEY